MEKIIIKTFCPDKQSNGLCYYDMKPLHCDKCKYAEQIKEQRKVQAIEAAVFSEKYDNLTCKELRELFIVELDN